MLKRLFLILLPILPDILELSGDLIADLHNDHTTTDKAKAFVADLHKFTGTVNDRLNGG